VLVKIDQNQGLPFIRNGHLRSTKCKGRARAENLIKKNNDQEQYKNDSVNSKYLLATLDVEQLEEWLQRESRIINNYNVNLSDSQKAAGHALKLLY
jgi:hypothetical protein